MPEGKQAAVEQDAFSIGDYLKAQRLIRGIELQDLSARTRIPLRSLERLEEGAFDREPDGFVRGFVRTVSLGLGLDPDDTLMRMLVEPRASRVPRVPGGLSTRSWLAIGVGLVAASGGVVLLVAALWTGPSAPEVVIRRDPVRALAEVYATSPAVDESRGEVPGPPPLPDISGRPPRWPVSSASGRAARAPTE